MKSKDILTIIGVAIVGVIVAIIATRFFAPSPTAKGQEVEKIESISAEFKQADKAYFNGDAINPTKIIKVAPNTNVDAFGESN